MTPVDVILPVRNTGRVFGLCMAHLYAYALPSGLVNSVTIMDNASTDPVLAAVLAEASRRGCRVIRHERDVGVWCSVNRGLAATTTPQVLIVTADVLLGPYLLPALAQVFDQTGLHYLAPRPGGDGLAHYDRILVPPADTAIAYNYNGACWLLDWAVLRDAIGWYDPQFYVCNGDTDYIARLVLHAQATQDARFAPHCLDAVHVCHLDKQTRRADSAERDSAIDTEDLRRFRAKWAHVPELLTAHPETDLATKLGLRAGWTEGRV